MTDKADTKILAKPVCGLIMPISTVDDRHTEEHWRKVQQILTEAAELADMKAQPVWENSQTDIIQAKILQNLYQNEVTVCDLSTRNPNVMLELGMRLTTKKPVILVAEVDTILPFDTSDISTEFYHPSLEYHSISNFRDRLKVRLQAALSQVAGGKYRSFMEQFQFETVQPATVSVPVDERLESKLDALINVVQNMEDHRRINNYISGIGLSEAVTRRPRTSNPFADIRSTDIPAFVVGARVEHFAYGKGRLLKMTGEGARVQYDSGKIVEGVPYSELVILG